MTLKEYAKRELDILGFTAEQDANMNFIRDRILTIIDDLEAEKIDEKEADFVVSSLYRSQKFMPLSALTGEDDEWIPLEEEEKDSSEGVVYQNLRCPKVFKEADGKAYNIEGIIFYEDDENGDRHYFTDYYSWVEVEFPYEVPPIPKIMSAKEFNESRES